MARSAPASGSASSPQTTRSPKSPPQPDPQSRGSPRRLGYARVSIYGQTLDAQIARLRAEECPKIYQEKTSGAQADCRELLKLLKELTSGDVVTVTCIDRLARS